MLSLTHSLENSFIDNGVEHKLNLNFDAVLRWYELMEDDELNSIDKVNIAYEIFTGNEPTDTEQAVKLVEQVAKYVSNASYRTNNAGDSSQGAMTPFKYYSYTQDAGAIYASFKEQYGIDLVDQQGKLHWDKFKALFDGLSDKTYFKRIIDIRTRSTDGLEGKELASLVEAQDYYQLDENRSVESKTSQMNGIFNTLKSMSK